MKYFKRGLSKFIVLCMLVSVFVGISGTPSKAYSNGSYYFSLTFPPIKFPLE